MRIQQNADNGMLGFSKPDLGARPGFNRTDEGCRCGISKPDLGALLRGYNRMQAMLYRSINGVGCLLITSILLTNQILLLALKKVTSNKSVSLV